MWRVSRALASAALCAVVAFAGTASAFCRTTTCEPDVEECSYDEHGCSEDGAPVFWPGGVVQFKIASGASPLRDISADDFELAVSGAIEAWQNAKCDDGKKPALEVGPVVLVEDAAAEFLEDGENENVFLFRDDTWPYERNAVAQTNVGFYKRSGELIDTDIELNSAGFRFATSRALGDTDLQAVLTHEIGHALGLDHSDVAGSTMVRETSGSSTEALRTIEPDDMAGICAIYPPEEPQTEEEDGGCAVSPRPARGKQSAVSALVLVALAWAQMSRRRHRSATR